MTKNSKKIITIIVTYNRLSLLKECIDALVKSNYHTDILIVNNNSSDGTKEFLSIAQKLYPENRFYIYNLDTNLNGAGGYNYGMKKAIHLDYDYFWIMDDDCIVNANSLEELINADEKLLGNYGFLSSKVLWIDGNICKTNVQRIAVARKIRDFKTEIVNVDYASFVSLFVKKIDVINVGLPIKEFIIWTDDLEWTRRLTYDKLYKNSKPGYLCNNSIVTHKTKDNKGVSIVTDSYDRIDRYKYIYRNDVYCFRREGLRGYLYIWFRNLYHIIRVILFSKNDKLFKINTIINGYNEGLRFNPRIEYETL